MHDGEFCQHIDEFSIEGVFGCLEENNAMQHQRYEIVCCS